MRKWVTNQFSIEIFACKFENVLKNCKIFIAFLKSSKNFEFEKGLNLLFLQCKKYPHISPGTPPPIREILYNKLLENIRVFTLPHLSYRKTGSNFNVDLGKLFQNSINYCHNIETDQFTK